MVNVQVVACGVSVDRDGRSLPGAQSDVRGWAARLEQAGVAREDMVLLAEQDDTDGPPDRAGFLAAVERMARRMSLDAQAQGLLVVSAHGGDGALFHAADGPVRAAEVVELLEALVPDRSITAILDLCPATDEAARLPALRAQDLVVHAADVGHPAEEHAVGAGWQGAFSWACHQVMDRWMAVGPHGALVPISPRVLAEQATLVLRGLGYGQQPVLVGPDARFDAPLLGGGPVRTAPLPPLVVRQVDPDRPDAFKVWDIQAGGSSVGVLVVTGPTWSPAAGWEANREYWSTSVPTTDFTLVPTSAGLPATVPNLKFLHVQFDPAQGTSSYTLASGYTVSAGGGTTGWLAVSPTRLDWYKASPVSKYYPASTLTFTKFNSSTTITAQLQSAPKK